MWKTQLPQRKPLFSDPRNPGAEERVAGGRASSREPWPGGLANAGSVADSQLLYWDSGENLLPTGLAYRSSPLMRLSGSIILKLARNLENFRY